MIEPLALNRLNCFQMFEIPYELVKKHKLFAFTLNKRQSQADVLHFGCCC